MIFSKLRHLIELSDGFELVNNGKSFIDPSVIYERSIM